MKPVAWTVCLDCGKRVTGDSIHTCSPQLKTLTDEEIDNLIADVVEKPTDEDLYDFAKAILKKAQK
jgi:hypothetical protein